MRYLKKFYESKIDSYKYEILRHPGWVDVDPPEMDHWDFQLEFQLQIRPVLTGAGVEVFKKKGQMSPEAH